MVLGAAVGASPSMTFTAALLAGAYFVFFLGSVVAMLWWVRRKRRSRHPLDKDLRLLRMPGETQFKLITEFEEALFVQLIIAASVPIAAAGVAFEILSGFRGGAGVVRLAASAAVFIAAFLVSARWVGRRLTERNNRYLGYFGERVVAESLEPLKSQGWRIFHDVPCESGKDRFNIDHVAVGPSGVFAIETKTRRKGHSRAGRKDHEVWFTGAALSWPWMDSRHEVDQALGAALWLQKKLGENTGDPTPVSTVIAIPGWMVIEKARGPLRVVNPKFLPDVLASRPATLTPKQIDLFARQLEARCRTVEY